MTSEVAASGSGHCGFLQSSAPTRHPRLPHQQEASQTQVSRVEDLRCGADAVHFNINLMCTLDSFYSDRIAIDTYFLHILI